MCFPDIHKYVFQVYACVCVCVFRARIYIYIYICVCVFACAHMCVPHVHICAFTCAHMRVARVHICVFTCTHVCVLIRHVYVFQENTCLLSDEHLRVCLLRVHFFVCVFTCTHCVFTHAHMCVPTGPRVHTSVFQLDTRLCSRRTRVCYQMNTRVCLCFLRAHKCVCSHVQYTCVCSTCAVFTCTHMCVHVYTRLCSN